MRAKVRPKRRGAKPAKAKVKAKRAGGARELEKRLAESLEQQAATAEILRRIGTSPMDAQPVFDGIARSGVRVCGAQGCALFVVDGDTLRVAATHGVPVERVERFRTQFPMPLNAAEPITQMLHERRIIHLANIEHNPAATPEDVENARLGGYRTRLMVPMVRGDSALGLIAVTTQSPAPFSDQQVALLETFADQAVIAIENVRLFTELHASNRHLTDALDQQTATAEILKVISGTPTDAQPVFDTIVRNAGRVCDAVDVMLILRKDEEQTVGAYWGSIGGALGMRVPLTRGSVMGRAIVDARPVHVEDLQSASEFPEGREFAMRWGHRTTLGVPLLREGDALGALLIRRTEVRPFSDAQIAMLQTFADQAVIAIENVRLFTELGARNRDLTEALEQQTATSEILRVMSRSQTDVQAVFDTIVRSAMRLCGGLFGVLYRFDGELIHLVAEHNFTPEALEEARRVFPARPSRGHGATRAIFEVAVVQIEDTELEPDYEGLALSRAVGWRSGLFVPMMREGAPIGVVVVARAEPGVFSDSEVELLKTFADQAVIAIENVRLFTALEARTNELTRSVGQLTALGEISQAVSSTLDVETVLQTIVSRASQLAGADGCAIYEYDGATEAFHIRATHNLDPVLVETLRASPLRKGEGAMGRAAETREPTQIADIAVPGAYQSHIRDTLLGAGYRALLSVPLLREGQIIGSLSLNRHAPGEFPPEAVEVLKTFATQSALAIQNARLFREIADKSRQLEAASRHKSEFLANMSHELRTPLNAIIGFSEVLNERMFGELNDKQAEYLKDIHASGTHLLSLINDILDLSKVEAGRMELELTDFDLPAAVDNAVTLVRERASRKGITVRIAVEEQVGMMRGDERKIRQVLLNLLSNAIKFTPEGGRIEVAAVPNDGSVEVSVHDTGVGIAPEDHEAVFEEFRQVGASAAKQEGTGLGLALARKFIELHGGKIWVTSQVGAGSTFTFTLPFQRSSGA